MKLSSVEFLGVTLIPFGSRPRRAIKVSLGWGPMALLPSGKVAINDSATFRYARPRHGDGKIHLARALYELGALSHEKYEAYRSEHEAANRETKRRDAADRLADEARFLGFNLTKAQRKRLDKLLS